MKKWWRQLDLFGDRSAYLALALLVIMLTLGLYGSSSSCSWRMQVSNVEGGDVEMTGKEAQSRIRSVIDVITRHGVIDGDQRKQWLLDQALRKLMSERDYERFRLAMPDWEEGTAP